MKKTVAFLLGAIAMTELSLAAELPTTKDELLLRALEAAERVRVSVHSDSLVFDRKTDPTAEEQIEGSATKASLESAFRNTNVRFRPGNTNDTVTITRQVLAEEGDILFEGSADSELEQDRYDNWILPSSLRVARLKLAWDPLIEVSDEEVSHVYVTLRDHRGKVTGHRYLRASGQSVRFPQDLLGESGEMYVVLEDGTVQVFDLSSGEQRPDIRIYVDTIYMSIENLVEVSSRGDDPSTVQIYSSFFEAYVLETRDQIDQIIVENRDYNGQFSEGLVVKDVNTHVETLYFLSPGTNYLSVPQGKYRILFKKTLEAEEYVDVELEATSVEGFSEPGKYFNEMTWEITVSPTAGDVSLPQDIHPSNLLWEKYNGEDIDDDEIEDGQLVSMAFVLVDGNAFIDGRNFVIRPGDEATFQLSVVITDGDLSKVTWETLPVKPGGVTHFKKFKSLPKRKLTTSFKG